MAEVLTYTSLLTDLAAYMDRGPASDAKVNAQLPRLINLAERNIVTDLKLQGYERTLTRSMASGTSIYVKPDRWKATVSMTIINTTTGDRAVLSPRSYEYIRAYWPDESETGTPKFYAEHGATHWLIGPTPNAAFGWEVKIWQMPPLLDASNTTNWLTDEAPGLLLDCCLRELAKMTKRWEDFARHDASYKEKLAAFRVEDVKKMMDRAAKREGP
jgi:hypothetical protein